MSQALIPVALQPVDLRDALRKNLRFMNGAVTMYDMLYKSRYSFYQATLGKRDMILFMSKVFSTELATEIVQQVIRVIEPIKLVEKEIIGIPPLTELHYHYPYEDMLEFTSLADIIFTHLGTPEGARSTVKNRTQLLSLTMPIIIRHVQSIIYTECKDVFDELHKSGQLRLSKIDRRPKQSIRPRSGKQRSKVTSKPVNLKPEEIPVSSDPRTASTPAVPFTPPAGSLGDKLMTAISTKG